MGTYMSTNISPEVKNAETNLNYEYLVFSGGGVKGISYCGALKVLNEMGILKSGIKGFAGTSAGSIVAGLLAIGYTVDEILSIVSEIDIKKLIGADIGIVRDAINLFEHYGMFSGASIDEFLGTLIKNKVG